MKKVFVFTLALVGLTSMSFTSFTDVCAVMTLGTHRLDLSKGATSLEITSDKLVESFKRGLVFAGASQCPGAYELVDVTMTITADKDVTSEYDADFVRSMSSMESYLLVRYFNNAKKVNLTNVKLKDTKGNIVDVPSIAITVK